MFIEDPVVTVVTSNIFHHLTFFNFFLLQKGENTYTDPVTGYMVFTEEFLRKRRACCGNGCRHVSCYCLRIVLSFGFLSEK